MRYEWSWGAKSLLALALVFVMSGCGNTANTSGNSANTGNSQANSVQSGNGQTDAAGNPPFQNSLKLEVAPVVKTYNPVAANPQDFTRIQAVDANGKTVTLDARKEPILFVAYWCPHCQRTLVLLSRNESQLSQLPVVLSMGFQPNTTLAEAKKLTAAEHSALHLSSRFQVYYGLNVDAKKLVPIGFPTMVYSARGKLEMLYAEHTLAIWKQALKLAE